MAQPATPWNHNTFPLKGSGIPGVVVYAGMFTTDSNGTVTSVSGLSPGMTVSGTSLSSGVYTCFFGQGPNINQIGNGVIGGAATSFAGGSPTVVDSFNRVLYLQAATVLDTGVPVTEMWQTTQKDATLGQGKLQYLKQNVLLTNQVTSQSGVFAPGVAKSKTVQVLAVLWVHKDSV